jgi:hypothetical protein
VFTRPKRIENATRKGQAMLDLLEITKPNVGTKGPNHTFLVDNIVLFYVLIIKRGKSPCLLFVLEVTKIVLLSSELVRPWHPESPAAEIFSISRAWKSKF